MLIQKSPSSSSMLSKRKRLSVLSGLLMTAYVFSGLLGCSSTKNLTESISDQLADHLGEEGARKEFQIRRDWTIDTLDKTNLVYRKINRAKVVLHQNLVIQANAIDGIKAFDAQTGSKVWNLKIPFGVEASLILQNGILYFGGLDGQFYSAKASTGQVLWSFPTKVENLSEPILVDDVVYFVTGNNTVYALDAKTGKQLWLYSRPDPSQLSIRGGSRPGYYNHSLIIGFSDGAVVSLIAETGAVKWEKVLNKNKRFKDIDSDPLVEGDFVYVTGYDESTYCLRAATGDMVWKSSVGGYGSLAIQQDRLFVPSSSAELVALSKETGRRVFAFPLTDGLPTGVSFLKGLAVFGESQGALRFIDSRSGKQVGYLTPGRGIMSTPVIDEKNNYVYFISGEALLYRLEAGWNRPNPFPYLR